MRDDWYGHRSIITGLPLGDKDAWLEWDYVLIDVLQTIEDYTDEYGLLAWQREDEAVEVDAVKKIHPFKRQVDLATAGSDKKPYKPEPGEYFVPEVWSRRTDEEGNEVLQTYTQWLESQLKKKD